jgi:short-subunit dehydrogenase
MDRSQRVAAELRTHEKVVADFGKVDVLVNNAGTSRAMAFETFPDEIRQEDLDLKLFAAIRLSRLVWPGMRERNGAASSMCSMSAPRRLPPRRRPLRYRARPAWR